MGTFLLSTNGTHGDVLPFIALGRGLVQRGHEVVLYTHEYYRAMAAAAGVRLVATDTEEGYARQLADAADLLVNVLADPANVREFHRRNGLFDQIRFEYDRMAAVVADRPAGQVVVASRHTSGLSVLLAREKLGVPAAWIAMSPTQFMAMPLTVRLYPEALAEPLNGLRSGLGLGPVADWAGWLSSADLSVGLWPEWFDAAGEPAPAEARLAGFLPLADAEEGPLPDGVAELLADRPILVTGGSGRTLHPDWYRAAIEGCTAAGRPVLVACRHPEILPPGVTAFPHLPFASVMPHVAAVVHHGGILTVARALAAGVPQLVLAHGHDRPDNGARLRRLGLGEWLPPARWASSIVAERLAAILATDLPAVPSSEDAVESTCVHLESLLGTRPRRPEPRVSVDGLSPERRALLTKWLARSGPAKVDPVPAPRPPRADGDEVVSFPQRRVWLGMQLDPGSVGFHVATALRLTGQLDSEALDRAVAWVVARHDALRTVPVDTGGDEPRQRVASGLIVAVRRESVPVDGVQRRVEELRAEPFDLVHGPLIRVALLRVAPTEHVLVLVAHHFIVDGSSVGTVMRELAAAYAAGVSRTPVPLPEAVVQYPDVAAWQRRTFTGARRDEILEHWRRTLADVGDTLDLGLPAPSRPVLAGLGEMPVRLDPAAVRALAGGTGSLAPALLTAFMVLVSHHCGQWERPVGVFVAGRPEAALGDVVGTFTDLVAVRADLRDGPSVRAAVDRVRLAMAGALARPAPFEDVVAAVGVPRVADRPALVQVGFNLHNFAFQHAVWPGLEVSVLPVDSGHTDLDLTLVVVPTHDGGVRATLEYPTERFEAAAVARVADRLGVLVTGLAQDLDAPVWQADWVPPVERAVLAAWARG